MVKPSDDYCAECPRCHAMEINSLDVNGGCRVCGYKGVLFLRPLTEKEKAAAKDLGLRKQGD